MNHPHVSANPGVGIGAKRVTHVITERVVLSSRITVLRLTVAETNTTVRRRYARAGFRAVDGAATYDRGQRALGMAARSSRSPDRQRPAPGELGWLARPVAG